MHPRRPLIVLAVLATFAGQAATVYKWTDADGVVHYSDQPVPGAEKVYTGTGSSSTSGGRAAPAKLPPTAKPVTTHGLGYSQFFIVTPAPDQSFFGDEPIPVQLAL